MPKPDLDLIVVAGSPGSGKSSLCTELCARWNVVPVIELSSLRNLHLNRAWSNQSEEDRAISFDHLVYIVHSYAKRQWRPVLVTDLRDEWVARIDEFFADLHYVIITLFTSDALIRGRVEARTEGFVNVNAAVEWNRALQTRQLFRHECKVESSGSVADTADRVEEKFASLHRSKS